MIHYLGVVLASFVYIAAKAFQQLNVVHDYKLLVPGTTFVMAVCEVGIVGNIAIQATGGSWAALAFTVAAMTIGSSLGALAAMSIHKRMRG